jgi:hypothetical protein
MPVRVSSAASLGNEEGEQLGVGVILGGLGAGYGPTDAREEVVGQAGVPRD